MHSFVLQDFTTIRGNYNVTVTQSESSWHDLESYEDLVMWLDVREVTFATGMNTLTMNFQTAPIKDEILFTTMTNQSINIVSGTSFPLIKLTTTIMSQSTTSVPLGRYLRWQLVPVGGTLGPWDATFRVILCANAVCSGGSAKSPTTSSSTSGRH